MFKKKNPGFEKLQVPIILTISLLAVLGCSVIWFSYYAYNQFTTAVQRLQSLNNYDSFGDRMLIRVHEAESSFREYLADKNDSMIVVYKDQLYSIETGMDSLINSEAISVNAETGQQLAVIIQKKIRLAGEIALLYAYADSLLHDIEENIAPLYNNQNADKFKTLQFLPDGYVSDTIKNRKLINDPKKRNLFQRLGDAINNRQYKNEVRDSTSVKSYQKTKRSYDSSKSQILGNSFENYKKQFDELNKGRENLLQKEKQAAHANYQLLMQLEKLFMQFKALDAEENNYNRAVALEAVQKSNTIIMMIASVLTGLTLLLALLLIFYRYKIKQYHELLKNEKQVAVDLMQRRTEYFSLLTHEIRNPLHVITNMVNTIEHTENNDKIQAIKTSSELLLSTVNDLLDTGSLESGTMRFENEIFYPLTEVAQIANAQKQWAASKNTVVTLEADNENNIAVKGDAARLRQVLVNIVSNAIKFTEAGTVTIKAALQENINKYVLHVTVTDTGAGMSKEMLGRLFKTFSKGEHRASGSGLGLYICRLITEQQGGEIRVKSTENKGSSFYVEIPYEKTEEEITAKKDPDEIIKGKKIIIADDDLLNRTILRKLLEIKGVQVTEAGSGRKAAELINQGQYDMLITDIMMDDMNGYELAILSREIKKGEKKSMTMMALTGSENEQLKNEETKLFDAVLIKPVTAQNLYDTIAKILSTNI